MSTNDTDGRESHEREPKESPSGDGSAFRSVPSKRAIVPVRVPPEMERAARERADAIQEHPDEERDVGEILDEIFADRIDVVPQYLTRDVVHSGGEAPLTRVLYTLVPEQLNDDVEAAALRSEMADSVEEWVRQAVRLRLSIDDDWVADLPTETS